MLVAKDEPTRKDVEAVTDFIRFGAEIAKIVFISIVNQIKESANVLPMVHLCETIEDCHSIAKIHIRSSMLIFLYHFRYAFFCLHLTTELAMKEQK